MIQSLDTIRRIVGLDKKGELIKGGTEMYHLLSKADFSLCVDGKMVSSCDIQLLFDCF
jgi:hypothetical protein